MVDRRRGVPASSETGRVGVSPTAMSSISSISSRPSPSSSTEPSATVGRASGARSVLNTTNSWVSSGPLFVTSNVTSPAGAELEAGMTANSWTVTSTVVPPPVAPVSPPSSSLHPAATRDSAPTVATKMAARRRRERRTMVPPSSLNRGRCVRTRPYSGSSPRGKPSPPGVPFVGLAGVLVGEQRSEDQLVVGPVAGPRGQGVRIASRREQRREVLARDHAAAGVRRCVRDGLAEQVQRGLERPLDRVLRQFGISLVGEDVHTHLGRVEGTFGSDPTVREPAPQGGG